MKTIFNKLNNLTIRTFGATEVDLPQLDDDVEITYYAKNGLIGIRHKMSYSEKLIPCDDLDALVKALTVTEPSSKTAEGKDNKSTIPSVTESKTCDYSDIVVVELADSNSNKDAETVDFSAFAVDPDTGEVIELSRSYEGLRRSWKRQCESAKNSACWSLTRFFTCTLDCKPTYEQLNRVISSFCKWLTRNYEDLMDNCFIFCEPCEGGSWHAHFLLAFVEYEPTDFQKLTKKWWARYNTQPCDEQVVFSDNFESVDDLLRVLEYLNPTSKDKRDRIKYYLKHCQPMRHIGNVTEPNKALAKFETVQKIVHAEKREYRRAVEVKQTDTGVMIYNCRAFLFDTNNKVMITTNAPEVIDTSTASDGGKVDYFHCKDGECNECARQTVCDRHGRCECCVGYDTSFCRGCIYDDDD